MPFDADKEAVKITTMATDLMNQDAQTMQKGASCNLMNEWHNLSADERNATWHSIKNLMPTNERKEDPETSSMHLEKSNNAFGSIVTGDIRANGDAFGLEFHGDNGKHVTVMNFADRGVKESQALASRTDEKAPTNPMGWCEVNDYGK